MSSTPDVETTILQVVVQELSDFDTCGKKMTFGVRLPHDVWLQEVNVSALEYEELLDRCWEVIKKRVMEHYKTKDIVDT